MNVTFTTVPFLTDIRHCQVYLLYSSHYCCGVIMLTVEQSLFFDRGERLVFYSYWLQFLFYIADISHKNGVFFRFHTVSMLRFPSEISFLGTAVF